MARYLLCGLATFLLGAVLSIEPARANEDEHAAWHDRIGQVVTRTEDRCRAVDAQDADTDGSLNERLTALNTRVRMLERSLELPGKRFWLYKGDDTIHLLSSQSQMATALEARASLVASASRRKLVDEANAKARKARLERERQAQQARAEAEAARAKQEAEQQASGQGGGARPRKPASPPAPKTSGPRIIKGQIVNRITMTLINLPLAKNMWADFTVFFPVSKGDAATDGGSQTPDPEVQVLIMYKPEGLSLPKRGAVEFSSGEEGEEGQKREVKGTYVQVTGMTAAAGGKTTLQILRSMLEGTALKNVVDPQEEKITHVEGVVASKTVGIDGKGLELLKQLLKPFGQAASPATAQGVRGGTTTDGGTTSTSSTGAPGRGQYTPNAADATPTNERGGGSECPKAGPVGR